MNNYFTRQCQHILEAGINRGKECSMDVVEVKYCIKHQDEHREKLYMRKPKKSILNIYVSLEG